MNRNLLSFTTIPDNFQKELFGKISRILKNNESLQLYGAPGSGNTLIAKALVQSQSIRNLYFKDDYKFVLLDGNMLLERSSLGLTSLFFNSLVVEGGETLNQTNLQSKIEEAIFDICDTRKLVLVIDHIQDLMSPELEPFFRNLYNIYRKLEPRFNFIFISSGIVDNEFSYFGPTGRLLGINKIKAAPFGKEDSEWFISEKEKQLDTKLNKEEKEKIIALSGGFPRTIKRLVESVAGKYKLSEIEENPGLDPALAMHFDELTSFTDILPNIPILERYFKAKNTLARGENVEGIIFGKRLTKNEEKLLKYFLKNKGGIPSRADGMG
ncbi:MAG: hypothetical protein US95_C0006G0019 [Candidatus Woesebacteria bacterium GW2011_GWB1_38_5]|uniref:Uncharacterized protein n=1 Tax=Candidatus Woesebacteria bacterium GW2011_GWB1_38_5 TaxID=1618568 RepID=A0A0G0K8Y1_9BACT|nr:MAG: hypothetical protein US95_C0006G0019 [Candidatus Woesebacteria bacterium GW2011_GWB1_38_5]